MPPPKQPAREATDIPSSRRPLAWESPFLAELARTGNATPSAVVAGVDRTNAQARRKRVPAFAAAWDIALAEYRAGRSFQMGLSAGKDEARAHAGGAKMMRVGAGRWSKAAEGRFLIELGTSGKVRRAAAAAGFSEEAICRRRRKEPQFAEACDMAIEEGKARVEALLVAWTERSFDPDAVPMPADGAVPKVSVSEAIKIVQLRPSTRLRMSGEGGPGTAADCRSEGMRYREEVFGGRIAHMNEEEVSEEFYKSISAAVNRKKDEMIADGWSRQGGHMIPPGYGILANVRLRPLQLPPEAAGATFSPITEEGAETGDCPHCRAPIGLTFAAPSG